jgi:hypothetical protein
LGKKKKLRGTDGPDELTGTKKKKRIYGFDGDDLIRTHEGKYRVWGGVTVPTLLKPLMAGRDS